MAATPGSALLPAPERGAAREASVLETEPCGDPETWNALARTRPGGTAFHDWSFLDLQERLLGFVVERHLLLLDGRPVGIVPLARRGRRSPRAPWVPFPHLGPALPTDLLGVAMSAVRRLQRERGVLLARFDLAPSIAAVAGLLAGRGIVVRRDGTVVLQLDGPGSVDAAMSRSRRQSIARAVRNGVQARPALPGEIAAGLHRATSEAYARRGTASPWPDRVGAEVEAWAEGRDDVFLGSVLVGERLVGSTVLLGTNPIAAGWLGASLPVAGVDVGGALTRAALQWAADRGHRAVDFGGRVCDEVERFKLSFGGRRAATVQLESLVGPVAALSALRRR